MVFIEGGMGLIAEGWLALKSGDKFPWQSEPGVTRISCSDSKNPEVFKIRLID